MTEPHEPIAAPRDEIAVGIPRRIHNAARAVILLRQVRQCLSHDRSAVDLARAITTDFSVPTVLKIEVLLAQLHLVLHTAAVLARILAAFSTRRLIRPLNVRDILVLQGEGLPSLRAGQAHTAIRSIEARPCVVYGIRAIVLLYRILELHAEIALAHACLRNPALAVARFIEVIVARIIAEQCTHRITQLAVLHILRRLASLICVGVFRKGTVGSAVAVVARQGNVVICRITQDQLFAAGIHTIAAQRRARIRILHECSHIRVRACPIIRTRHITERDIEAARRDRIVVRRGL